MFSAQLKEEAEKWTAYRFTNPDDSTATKVPQIWPFSPFRIELDSWFGSPITVNMLQACDLGFNSTYGGIYAFTDALFSNTLASASYPGVVVKTFTVPSSGHLRETINPALPWLAVWATGDSLTDSDYALRVKTMGAIDRGPSRLSLAEAPTYGERMNLG